MKCGCVYTVNSPAVLEHVCDECTSKQSDLDRNPLGEAICKVCRKTPSELGIRPSRVFTDLGYVPRTHSFTCPECS